MANTLFNPVGNVNMRMNGPGVDWMVDHARRCRTLTCTTIDQVDLARRLHDEAGVPYSTMRFSGFEPHANSIDETAIRDYAYARYADLRNARNAIKSPNVHVHVNCEQGFREDDFRMYVHLIDAAMQDPEGPVPMVFWNGATGVVRNGFWKPGAANGADYHADNNGWTAPWAMQFVRHMHEVRNVRVPSGAYAFLLGVHGYSMWYPLMAVDAGMHRKTMRDRWDARFANAWDAHDAFLLENMHVDWKLPQDHIGRDVQAIRHALGWMASADDPQMKPTTWTPVGSDGVFVDCPRIIVTECGPDDMGDVRGVHVGEFRNAGGYAHARGYKSHAATWAQQSWFPRAGAGDVLHYWNAWAWYCVLRDTSVVLGQHAYCKGDTGGWAEFNTSGDTAFDQKQVNWQVEIEPHWLGAEQVDEDQPDEVDEDPPSGEVPNDPTKDEREEIAVELEKLADRVRNFAVPGGADGGAGTG